MLIPAAAFLLCGVLPAISTPELLLDLDESPSTISELVGANSSGMLVHGLNKDWTHSLWWTPWDGSPFLVIDRTNAVTTAPLGEDFVLFVADGAGQTAVLRLSIANARVEPLTTVPDPVEVIDSSSQVWWVDPNGTSTTDGTPSGTRLVAPGVTAVFQAGDSLYAQPVGPPLLRWTGGQLIDAGVAFRSLKRAGAHVVAADKSVFNELGEELVRSTNCVAHAGGETAWVGCMGDGGVWLYATDGTPGGTRLRAATQGNFPGGDVLSASSEYFVGNLRGTGCTLLTSAAGPLQPLPGCDPGSDRIFGDVLVNEHSVRSLSPPSPVLELGPLRYVRAAGRRAVFATQRDYRLTDGTEAGTRVVPSEWPAPLVTASSSPRLESSNGDRALYRTASGVWVTDGTREGTVRVGESAAFWGKRVLAAQQGALVVFDADGKSWVPPNGTWGVAHRSLIGQDGCAAFSIDEERRQQTLALDGCVKKVTPGAEGALVETDLGAFFWVRAGRVFKLGGDVSSADDFRCGGARCWYLGIPDAELQPLHTIDLDNGTVRLVSRLNTGGGSIGLLGASSLGALTKDESGNTMIVFKDGVLLNLAADAQWLFTADGRLATLESRGINLLSYSATPPPPQLSFDCARPIGLGITADTLHALCGDGTAVTLRSGPLEGPLTVIDAGLEPRLPQGDELAWSSVVRDGQSALRVARGLDSREFPALQGAHFARVRSGFVFAGTGVIPDEELYVARVPPQGCGCGTGGGAPVLCLALAALARFSRRARWPRRSSGGWSSPRP